VNAPYPWLAALWEDLVGRLEAGRLPHALLLTGPRGWGQQELALALAKRLLHLGAGPVDDAIVHPDFRLVTIEEGKRQILVDQIRSLNQFAFETASAAGAKVAVIAPAEALNPNAANALLKTLEEPSADTHLLLCTSAAGRLLPTITSRCQRVSVGVGVEAAARRWVAEKAGSGTKTDGALFFAGGAPLAALELLEDGSLEDAENLEQTLLDPRGDVAAITRIADRHDVAEVLDWWLRIVVRWHRQGRGGRGTFELTDALARAKEECLAVPLNAALVMQSLHRRWCDLAHKSVHSN
jgi:DNA polymerase-3 subunit delta'